jgi:hypothetical protein
VAGKNTLTPALPLRGRGSEHDHGTQRVWLVGYVAGVEACHVLSEADRIVVGSGVSCDLVVLDPLSPRRAFCLRRVIEHAQSGVGCKDYWQVEVFAGARVYLNGSLASRRDRVKGGDCLVMGCHTFYFYDRMAEGRDFKGNVKVGDLCRGLMAGREIPVGYLNGLPSWRDRLRLKRAGTTGAVVACLILLALLLFVPVSKTFEPVAPKNEVVVLADRSEDQTMTALDKVERKSFESAEEEVKTELAPQQVEPTTELETKAIVREETKETVAAAVPGRVVEDAGPLVSMHTEISVNRDNLTVERESTRMGRTAPAARRVVEEGAPAGDSVELASANARLDKLDMIAVASTRYAEEMMRAARPGPEIDATAQRAKILSALQPTAVTLESYRGTKIPVARVPETMGTLTVSSAKAGFAVDGTVSESEVAMSFKTGRFKTHGPGSPPEADPATYCYVGKQTEEGKDYLYVSFVCMDPNVDALVFKGGELANDDSIEIFMDTDGNRADYNQLIVNARGQVYSAYCPNATDGINGLGKPWASGVKVKTTVNKQAGRWVCEVLIPFANISPLPAKGAKIPVNFCRNFRGQQSGNPAHLQNWFSVWEGEQSNFHHPRLFGLLEWP